MSFAVSTNDCISPIADFTLSKCGNLNPCPDKIAIMVAIPAFAESNQDNTSPSLTLIFNGC